MGQSLSSNIPSTAPTPPQRGMSPPHHPLENICYLISYDEFGQICTTFLNGSQLLCGAFFFIKAGFTLHIHLQKEHVTVH